jgi:hypothetical protein
MGDEGDGVSGMIEREAQSIARAEGDSWWHEQGDRPRKVWQAGMFQSLEEYVAIVWRSRVDHARAAIEAISAAAREAIAADNARLSREGLWPLTRGDEASVYRAMIDAALKDSG